MRINAAQEEGKAYGKEGEREEGESPPPPHPVAKREGDERSPPNIVKLQKDENHNQYATEDAEAQEGFPGNTHEEQQKRIDDKEPPVGHIDTPGDRPEEPGISKDDEGEAKNPTKIVPVPPTKTVAGDEEEDADEQEAEIVHQREAVAKKDTHHADKFQCKRMFTSHTKNSSKNERVLLRGLSMIQSTDKSSNKSIWTNLQSCQMTSESIYTRIVIHKMTIHIMHEIIVYKVTNHVILSNHKIGQTIIIMIHDMVISANGNILEIIDKPIQEINFAPITTHKSFGIPLLKMSNMQTNKTFEKIFLVNHKFAIHMAISFFRVNSLCTRIGLRTNSAYKLTPVNLCASLCEGRYLKSHYYHYNNKGESPTTTPLIYIIPGDLSRTLHVLR